MIKILIGVFCLVALAAAFPSQDNVPDSNLNTKTDQPVVDPVPNTGDGAQDVAADGEEGEVGSRHWGGGYGGYGGYGGHGYGGYGGHHGHHGYGGYGGYGGHGHHGYPYGHHGHGHYYG